MAIVTNVVNLVRPIIVTSLSHWASTCVYNTMSVTHSITWFVCHRWYLLYIRVGITTAFLQ